MKETTYLERLAGADKIKPGKASDRDSNLPIGVATFTQKVAMKLTNGDIDLFPASEFTYLEKVEGLVSMTRQDGTEIRIEENLIYAIQYYNV